MNNNSPSKGGPNNDMLNKANTMKKDANRVSQDTHLNVSSVKGGNNQRAPVTFEHEVDDEDDVQKRASQLKSAYNLKS
jgi:hypothetical protein